MLSRKCLCPDQSGPPAMKVDRYLGLDIYLSRHRVFARPRCTGVRTLFLQSSMVPLDLAIPSHTRSLRTSQAYAAGYSSETRCMRYACNADPAVTFDSYYLHHRGAVSPDPGVSHTKALSRGVPGSTWRPAAMPPRCTRRHGCLSTSRGLPMEPA